MGHPVHEKQNASRARPADRAARRDAAAIEAWVGVPTEALEKIAALPVAERRFPAAHGHHACVAGE
jgi:hypothetical protein